LPLAPPLRPEAAHQKGQVPLYKHASLIEVIVVNDNRIARKIYFPFSGDKFPFNRRQFPFRTARGKLSQGVDLARYFQCRDSTHHAKPKKLLVPREKPGIHGLRVPREDAAILMAGGKSGSG
jgi:hypothetical protein